MTSLRSEIEVGLRNKNLSLHEAKKLLKSNLEEVVQLQYLSDNLLELSQAGRPFFSFPFADVSIADCIDAAVKKVEGATKKKSIEVKKSVQDITIQGIQDRMCELFVILLDNAVKYSPKKSTIIISAKKINGVVRVMFSDQGIGISEEDLPHIFDRFYRADRARTTDIPGYGLGLSIAKKIVEMHKGEISVKSAEGKGTVFIVELPLK